MIVRYILSTLSLVGISYSIMVFNVVIIKQNERNTDMYTPLAFLTGKIFPVYGTTHFYITTTTTTIFDSVTCDGFQF